MDQMQLDLTFIGWCMRDGVKQLLATNGFTVSFNEEYINKLIADYEKEGERFPEFYWTGSHWAEVIDV